MTAEPTSVSRSSRLRARIFSFVALGALATGVGWTLSQAYDAATDAFVAPIILSPDNDLVLANKVKLSELQVEKSRDLASLESIGIDLEAMEKLVARMQAIRVRSERSLDWTRAITKQAASSGLAEHRRVDDERALLEDMRHAQERLAATVQANVRAGLATPVEYAKEVQVLNQLDLARFENEHARIQSELALGQVALTQASIASGGATLATPEQLFQEEQVIRVELELVKLDSERRGKLAEKRVLEEKLAKINELENQLRARPIFRATEHTMDVAFVPYTQIDEVANGAPVYDCVWGLFHCRSVGKVAEVVPGEVVLPDPWGNQARGQYAVLDLRERESAKSKTLRVRAKLGGPTSSTLGRLFARVEKMGG